MTRKEHTTSRRQILGEQGPPAAVNRRTAGESAKIGQSRNAGTETAPESNGVEVASPVEGAHPLVVSFRWQA